MSDALIRRRDCLEALAAHNLALARLSSFIPDDDTLRLAVAIQEFEGTAITLGTCLRELFMLLRGCKTTSQLLDEELGINLSPVAVARDQRLRTLYENVVKARGTDSEQSEKDVLKAFVRREYP